MAAPPACRLLSLQKHRAGGVCGNAALKDDMKKLATVGLLALLATPAWAQELSIKPWESDPTAQQARLEQVPQTTADSSTCGAIR